MPYAAQADLTNVGLPPTAIPSTITAAQIAACAAGVSDEMDSYFRARYGASAVPFVAWDNAVTYHAARMLAYRVILLRGFNPQSASDVNLRTGYEDAVKWLMAVQRQQAHPNVTLAAGAVPRQEPGVATSSVVLLTTGGTATKRGW